MMFPPLDAAAVDSGNRQRFLRSTGWKKVGDDFFHGYQEVSGGRSQAPGSGEVLPTND
jgi:hypothetical protein